MEVNPNDLENQIQKFLRSNEDPKSETMALRLAATLYHECSAEEIFPILGNVFVGYSEDFRMALVENLMNRLGYLYEAKSHADGV